MGTLYHYNEINNQSLLQNLVGNVEYNWNLLSWYTSLGISIQDSWICLLNEIYVELYYNLLSRCDLSDVPNSNVC